MHHSSDISQDMWSGPYHKIQSTACTVKKGKSPGIMVQLCSMSIQTKLLSSVFILQLWYSKRHTGLVGGEKSCWRLRLCIWRGAAIKIAPPREGVYIIIMDHPLLKDHTNIFKNGYTVVVQSSETSSRICGSFIALLKCLTLKHMLLQRRFQRAHI